ncbi:uncharacterized protein LOC106652851 isoform X1 [Trichogramma pretiosum]|uniref:uncharacterized protein LOC106652851 isoform X1 n=1 Tax=Trichogramma pretiosum TaxID=7493 RepID=UPI0006C9CB9F|nr:uncharacterized protein LOC106652851 isoform X1 [Trichogramma pretiosum]
MSDKSYKDFLVNSEKSSTMKNDYLQELGQASASVPIPGNYRDIPCVFDQFSPSPLAEACPWNTNRKELSFEHPDSAVLSLKMDDDDDIFQVDQADLIQGPTLAELNSNEDTLLGDLNFDDLLLPDENIPSDNIDVSIDFPTANTILSTNIVNVAPNSLPQTTHFRRGSQSGSLLSDSSNVLPSCQPVGKPMYQSALHELLMKQHDAFSNNFGDGQLDATLTPPTRFQQSRLSMSAPAQTLCFDQLWAHREPRQHLLSTGSLGIRETGSTSSISTGGALSPNLSSHIDLPSHDEGYDDSDDDSDHYEDYSSDNESGASENEDILLSSKKHNDVLAKESKSRKEKFFWQYNVQAKGPKGQRLVARARLENPHVLHQATDPVFSPNCSLQGIKHSGKARKGDGNDLTPNPRKLNSIGKELDKLNRIINDMTPVSELPFTIRPKTRKEKNKLASRACRLKKKAQHEANKIKLFGLEQEHKRLILGIRNAKEILKSKLEEVNPEVQDELTKQMEKILRNSARIKVANNSTDFVNNVLQKTSTGSVEVNIDKILK